MSNAVGELARFMEHSGAVVLVIVFLMVAIGAAMVMTTAGRPDNSGK